MTNKKLALSVLASCIIFPALSSAQAMGALGQLYSGAGLKASPAAAVPAVSRPMAVPQEYAGEEPASYGGTAVTIWHAIARQVGDLLPGSDAPSFEQISERVLKAAKSPYYPARRAGQASLFTDPGFVAEFERATGARFTGGNYAHFLIDGEASFAQKDYLIQHAKKSIFVSSWAFYDDTTGYEAAQMLIAAHRRGVDVKVMVDTSWRPATASRS